jgi:hypothetical protein
MMAVVAFVRTTKLHDIRGRAAYIFDEERQEIIITQSPNREISKYIDFWKPYARYERENIKTWLPLKYTRNVYLTADGNVARYKKDRAKDEHGNIKPPVYRKGDFVLDGNGNKQFAPAKNNEGREVKIALPNEWINLPREELIARAQALAVAAIGKDTDMQWAIHFNKAGNKGRKNDNLHMHIIFSERKLTAEFGTWDRDIYHTADGKIARAKKDRARDENGNIKPPVHYKGTSKGGFTEKDTRYKKRSWSHNTKLTVVAEMERMGVRFEQPGNPLYQYHEGNGINAPKIAQKNSLIRANNAAYHEFISSYTESKGQPPSDEMLKYLKSAILQAVKEGYVADIHLEEEPAPVAKSKPEAPAKDPAVELKEINNEIDSLTYKLKQLENTLDKRFTDKYSRERRLADINGWIQESGIFEKRKYKKQYAKEEAGLKAYNKETKQIRAQKSEIQSKIYKLEARKAEIEDILGITAKRAARQRELEILEIKRAQEEEKGYNRSPEPRLTPKTKGKNDKTKGGDDR